MWRQRFFTTWHHWLKSEFHQPESLLAGEYKPLPQRIKGVAEGFSLISVTSNSVVFFSIYSGYILFGWFYWVWQ
jgi:hypothetical protein